MGVGRGKKAKRWGWWRESGKKDGVGGGNKAKKMGLVSGRRQRRGGGGERKKAKKRWMIFEFYQNLWGG